MNGSRLNRIRSLGIALLYYGLSCRKAADVLRFLGAGNASHEAVREWYHRAKELLSAPQKQCRPMIAIDETKINVEGRWHFLWVGCGRHGEQGAALRGNYADERLS